MGKEKKLHLLPNKISNNTLNHFVNTIKAQFIFNVYETVGNKTESRMVAEWSLRSTLAYAMVVASNHFIPNIEPTIYHPKKKDLNPDAIELWVIVENSYNKLISSTPSNKVSLYPVLPHLVTMTNEVTIFAMVIRIVVESELFLIPLSRQVVFQHQFLLQYTDSQKTKCLMTPSLLSKYQDLLLVDTKICILSLKVLYRLFVVMMETLLAIELVIVI